jgi:two-component system sensor histidine kinase UhpB
MNLTTSIHKLLRIPIFYKILLANAAIIALGAAAGTVITVWHVRQFPEDIHYGLIVLFTGAGVLISFVVNNWVLKQALSPLDRLQGAVDHVRSGASQVRIDPGPTSDERFDRLAETFNDMLERLEANAEQLQELSHKILQAQEAERQRLARELHDEAAQALTSLLVHLRLLERAHTPEDAQKRVAELRQLTAQALDDVRRVALDLRPNILDDLGLAAALEWRVDEFNQIDGLQAAIAVEGMDHRLPREVELVLYRVGQESLSNVARHAQASRVEVSLRRENGSVMLKVCDDGRGFDPAIVDARSACGLGLLGMRERVGMIGGELTVHSAPGRGTQIRTWAPVVGEPLNEKCKKNAPRTDSSLVG